MRPGKQFNEREKVLLAIYGAFIFAKYTKIRNQANDGYFQKVKERPEFREVAKKTLGYNIEGYMTAIETKVTSAVEIRDLSTEDRSAGKMLVLLNDIVETNSKNSGQIPSEEQIQKISKFFAEDVCFINYDKVKECLKEV